MEEMIKINDPLPGIRTVQIFPQACLGAAGKMFFVDIDGSLYQLRIEANAAWLSGASASRVPADLITLLCKIV